MNAPRQLTLNREMIRQTESGGSFSKGTRKERRVFSSKQAMHIVLRSEKASGNLSFMAGQNQKAVRASLLCLAARWGITLYDHAINSNHVHLLLRARSKADLSGFLRTVSSRIAMRLTGAKKGAALANRFWSDRIYSKLVSWGREFERVRKYIEQNVLESLGQIPYTPRARRSPPETSSSSSPP